MSEVHSDTPFVFVSYSHEDRNFVTRLRTDLQAHGIEVWVDKEGIQAGTPDWEQALRDAIHTAHAVLFIASPDARNSRYVKDELRMSKTNCALLNTTNVLSIPSGSQGTNG